MDLGLNGRVVLVTGGSGGIGRATAQAFAREGARVAITYHDNADAASAVIGEIEARGGEAASFPLTLQNRDSVTAAVEAARERWGRIDTVVANAVQWPTANPDEGRFEGIGAESWREMLAANVEGTAATIAAALPAMRERRWGRIVLVSSSVAEEGVPGPSAYGPAKATYAGLARTLAWDAGRDGILVNVVGVGLTATERNRRRIPDSVRDQVAGRTPSRRLSDPADVAGLIVFLGSAANANITGETVYEGSSNGRSGHVVEVAA